MKRPVQGNNSNKRLVKTRVSAQVVRTNARPRVNNNGKRRAT